MKPASFDYFRAEKIDDALMALAANAEAQVLAGGQSLIAMMNLRLAKPGCLIDINRLTDLDYIRPEGDELAIGALTRHTAAASSPVVAEFCPLMTAAYDHIAHRAVRNRGSVGGNLCHADPSSENPAVAVASGATLVLKSADGERRVAAEDFFLGLYETAAQQNELLTEIRIPKAPAHQGWSFQETSTRKGDFALVGIAATLDCPNGTCTNARIVAVGIFGWKNAAMAGHQQIHTRAGHEIPPVLDIARKCRLSGIEVKRAHGLSGMQQRADQMHGGGGFSRTAFFIAHNDDLWAIFSRLIHPLSFYP